MKNTLKDLIGQEVRIYPSDSQKKQGTVESVEEYGVLFKITKSACPDYKVGSLHFISFSSGLSFATM